MTEKFADFDVYQLGKYNKERNLKVRLLSLLRPFSVGFSSCVSKYVFSGRIIFLLLLILAKSAQEARTGYAVSRFGAL